MKTIIFYRSSYKGNTLKIAQTIAEVLSAELVSIDSNSKVDISEYDLIGFGSAINFAAHDSHLQRIVSEQNLKGKNIFIFSTRCRPFVGAYHKPLKKLVNKQGGTIVGEFSCKGFDRTGPWVLVDGYNKARPNERDIFKARLFAEKLRRQLHPLATIYKSPVTEHFFRIPIRRKDTDIIAGNKVVFLNTSTVWVAENVSKFARCIYSRSKIRFCPQMNAIASNVNYAQSNAQHPPSSSRNPFCTDYK